MQSFVKDEAGNGALAREREALGAALDDAQGMIGTMVGFLTGSAEDRRQVYKVGLNTTKLLMSVGDLVLGWLLLRQADVALRALAAGPASDRDKVFYEGKIASARWFAANVLPELKVRLSIMEATDLDLMDLDNAAF